LPPYQRDTATIFQSGLLTEHHLTLGKLFSRDLISQKEYDKAMAITNYSFGTQVLAAKDYKTAIRYFFACIKI